MLRDRLRKLAGGAGTGRSEGDIHALEVVTLLQQFDFQLLAAELILASRASGRTEKDQLIRREVPLLEDFEELLADCAAGADNRCFHLLIRIKGTLLDKFFPRYEKFFKNYKIMTTFGI